MLYSLNAAVYKIAFFFPTRLLCG